jgi:hypothetical protein
VLLLEVELITGQIQIPDAVVVEALGSVVVLLVLLEDVVLGLHRSSNRDQWLEEALHTNLQSLLAQERVVEEELLEVEEPPTNPPGVNDFV